MLWCLYWLMLVEFSTLLKHSHTGMHNVTMSGKLVCVFVCVVGVGVHANGGGGGGMMMNCVLMN